MAKTQTLTEGVPGQSPWNATRAEFPALCTHELFERQVERTPNAVAVVFGRQRLTYRELNARANQVAHFLRKRGVGPDAIVGVALGRIPEMAVALIGVWKAGGAYVPLDPAYPQDRLAFMASDAGVKVLLTDEKSRALFPSLSKEVVCLDSAWAAIGRERVDNPAPLATPSHLAYVMYTSGSTGKPKGAMIVHRGLVNYLWWAIQVYGVSGGGSVPVHSSISFDLTVTSLYPALLTGGSVELLTEDVGAQNLIAALRRTKDRTLVKITPAHLELLSQTLTPEDAKGATRTFVIGGENLPAESLRFWRTHAASTRLINEYGPTETVVGCCVYEVQPGDPDSGPVPIGMPIANTSLYVLDPSLKQLGIGVTGELFIGGAGVARGYLNRPELTAERFLADPFSTEPGARMYKTGDLARYRADGVLEYLGRVDNQVKVRGYRIELGEIEATLAGHAAVQMCAVLAREDQPGDKQLVGYVVAKKGSTVSAGDVQQYLSSRLPDYMVPAHIVALDEFPLTENGKVDRKALPAPGARPSAGGGSPGSSDPGALQTETEKALAATWIELLQVDKVGREDSFFDLGGHSLLAMKAITKIRDVFAVNVELRHLFEEPTLAGLAGMIDGLK